MITVFVFFCRQGTGSLHSYLAITIIITIITITIIITKTIMVYTDSPPKSCIPSRAKMRMKRKSRNKSEMIERMLLSNEMTRLRSDAQYLATRMATDALSVLTDSLTRGRP